MELVSLGKGGVMIPTPGQTEQEYLGRFHDGRNGFVTLKQNKLENIMKVCEGEAAKASPHFPDSTDLFEEAVRLLLEQKKKR
jgi:hypothetical protein